MQVFYDRRFNFDYSNTFLFIAKKSPHQDELDCFFLFRKKAMMSNMHGMTI